MDTLSWTRLNPEIEFEPTVKLAYNKYPYKIEIACTGVAYLRGGFANVWEFVESRRYARKMNWGGSWRMSRLQTPNDEEIQALIQLNELLEQSQFKRRVEEPVLQLYSEDAQSLLTFAKKLLYPRMLSKVMLPRNAEEQKLIEQGLVIRRKPVTWKYRFHIREARYSWETRQQLLTYLKNLGDDVHVPPSVWDRLQDPKNSYIWGGYIDANDKNLATFIHLISSTVIRSIDEFHELDQGK